MEKEGCTGRCESLKKEKQEWFQFFLLSYAQVSPSAKSRQSSLLRRGRQHKVQWSHPSREQQPDRKTLRNLRLSGAVGAPSLEATSWMVFALKCVLCSPSLPVYMCTLSSGWILQEFSFALSAVRWFVAVPATCTLSFLRRSPQYTKVMWHTVATVMHKEKWEINESAHWLQSSFPTGQRPVESSLCKHPPSIQAAALSHSTR